MSDNREYRDDELANELRRRSGSAGTDGGLLTDNAHRRVLDRARSIRRRRAAAAGGGLTALAIVALIALPGSDDEQLAPGVTPPTTDVAPSTSAPQSPTSVAVTPTSIPATTVSLDGSPSTTFAGAATTTSTSTSPAPAKPPVATTTTTLATVTTTAAPAVTTTSTLGPATTPPFTQTYSSTGGSITVQWDGTALSLLSTAPNAGFQTEIEDSQSDRIRVRFRGDSDDSRIEVRADSGVVTHQVD